MSPMQKVVHISTFDVKGGAAKAAYRLHTGLRQEAIDSHMLVRKKFSSDETVSQVVSESKWFARQILALKSFLIRSPVLGYRLGKHCDGFSLCVGPCKPLHKICADADIVNLHWTNSMIDLPTFVDGLPSQVPIVITLHDVNWFTGGCHYPGSCRRFTDFCGACPELNSRKENDLSRRNHQRKSHYFDRLPAGRLSFVAPSAWMARMAESSKLCSGRMVEQIPYGIDTEIFKPADKARAKERFGIDPNSTVLLFLADSTGNHRKGFDLLSDALKCVRRDPEMSVLMVGEKTSDFRKRLHGFPITRTGYLSRDQQIVDAYTAADLFVIPSRQDNLPNTVLESLACSTPVVAFAVGGIPDMVIDGETGLLADAMDPAALAHCIDRLMEDVSLRHHLGQNGREHVVKRFTTELQAQRYGSLYHELIERAVGGKSV